MTLKPFVRPTGRATRAGLACFVTLSLFGCSGGDEPLTADRSRYEVGSGPAAKGESDSTGRKPDAGEQASLGAPPAPPRKGIDESDGAIGRPAPSSETGLGSPPSTPRPSTNEPTPNAAKSAGGGSTPQLLAELAKLDQTEPPPGRNQRELIENLKKWMAERIALADRILGSDASDKQKVQAARSKKVTLIQMSQLQMPNVDKGLRDLCKMAIQADGPLLQQFGYVTQLEMELAKTFAGANNDPQTIVDALDTALGLPDKNEELFNTVASAAIALQQLNHPELALKSLKAVEAAFKDSKQERIVALLGRLVELRQLLESGIDEQADAIAKGEPEAKEKFVATITKLVADKPGAGLLEKLTMLGQQFEFTRKYDVASQIYAAIEAGYKDHPDADLSKRALTQIAAGRKRADLVGKPFVVEGKTIDGSPFDWKKYEGKIVLVDFWATWCGPCRQEFPNIKRNYDKYKEDGFEVVGVNLDQERAELDQFLDTQPLPWTTVVDAQALVEQCGVESIPFVLLIGRDGRVLELHARGEVLGQRLAELIGGAKEPTEEKATEEKPVTEKPASEKPAEDKQDADKPNAEKPATEKPAEKQTEEKGADEKPAEKPASEKPESATNSLSFSIVPTASLADDKATDKTDAKGADKPAGGPKLPDVNPYAPRADLDAKELATFLEKMLDKPKSIQLRPGFSDAIVIAADRLIAHPDANDKAKLLAVTTKIDVLHRQATAGDKKADEQLAALANSLAKDERPKVAKSVRFLLLEQKTLNSDDAKPEQAKALLEELKAYFAQESLDARHLRLASNTVRLINSIEDADDREKMFAEYGGMFAKSSDKTLARYGKKLATPPEAAESDLVGKPLELAGRTLTGEEFDWKKYRGKVVIVDFWATWCGPCIREMPHVRETYEKHSAKGFDVVGVSLDQDLDALAEFSKEHKIPWTTLAGEETQELAKRYGVRGIPTMMLIGRDGKVVAVAHQIGALQAKLEELLKSS